jgi:hypothetical protein
MAIPLEIDMQSKFVRNMVRAGAVIGGSTVLLAQNANAAAMTLPAELTDALASVAVIGAGVFAIAVGVKLYKWIKGAL